MKQKTNRWGRSGNFAGVLLLCKPWIFPTRNSGFMSLDRQERAFVIASINARTEKEEEESEKINRKGR